MTALIMEHDNSARRNANEIIHMMETITNRLTADKLNENFREIDTEEIEDLLKKINEYNEHVNFLNGILYEN